MQVTTFFTLFALSLPVFFVIDLLWLGVFARDFYKNQLGNLLGDVAWVPAIIFYILFLIGLTFFATYPAVLKGTVNTAFLYGALFGFFTYMTYDLTNLATLRDWPMAVVLVDIVWGVVLSSIVAGGTYLLYQVFFG